MTFEEWKAKHSDLIENVAITFFNYERGVDTRTCYDELEWLLRKAFISGQNHCNCVHNEELLEELLEENTELKKQQFSLRNERNTFLAQNEQYEKDLIDFNENLTKAIEIIKTLADDLSMYSGNYQKELLEAEQFLKESE